MVVRRTKMNSPVRRWKWTLGATAIDGARFVVIEGNTPGTFSSRIEKNGNARIVLINETLEVTRERCAVFLLARHDYFKTQSCVYVSKN
jgi:hypothetical protein